MCPAPAFPPPGPSGRFPGFDGTTRALRPPVAHPASLRRLRERGTTPLPGASPRAARTSAARSPGGLLRRHPTFPAACLGWRRPDLPGSLKTPVQACPALRPRRDLDAHTASGPGSPSRCLLASRCRLPPFPRRRLPHRQISRGSITRPTCSLSTLRSPGHPGTTQDSVPAGGQPCRAGLDTRRVSLKSFGSTSCFSSSFPGLRLAHGNDFPPSSDPHGCCSIASSSRRSLQTLREGSRRIFENLCDTRLEPSLKTADDSATSRNTHEPPTPTQDLPRVAPPQRAGARGHPCPTPQSED